MSKRIHKRRSRYLRAPLRPEALELGNSSRPPGVQCQLLWSVSCLVRSSRKERAPSAPPTIENFEKGLWMSSVSVANSVK
jgi:hypothetical protein